MKCEDCKYYELIDIGSEGKYAALNLLNIIEDRNICRRHSPIPTTLYLKNDEAWNDIDFMPGAVVWPIVCKNDWCGEFEAKL